MTQQIDVDKFVKENQEQIEAMVNAALNRAGEIVNAKVKANEVQPTIQDVLPLMLYEILVTNTVSTLRLAADMLEERQKNEDQIEN